MKITKRDLLRIIAEESNAISAEKVLEEGTGEDADKFANEFLDKWIQVHGREAFDRLMKAPGGRSFISNATMDYVNAALNGKIETMSDLVHDTGTGKPIPGTGALGGEKRFIDTGYVVDSDNASGPSLKESIRKLVRKHTKAPERLALEESIRRSLRTVLTQD